MSIKPCLSAIILALPILAVAQSPVKWTYSAKKTGDKTYEIHLSSVIDPSWHIYSQSQPEDAIAIPTTIKFNNNPLLTITGKIKEVGKMEKYTEKTLGITQNQYSDKVDFVQVVKLKSNAKTKVSGTIEFQVCTDEKCLPPKTIPFTINIQ